jgi:hypothetical protein
MTTYDVTQISFPCKQKRNKKTCNKKNKHIESSSVFLKFDKYIESSSVFLK